MNSRSWSSVRIAVLSVFLLALIAQPMMAQSQNVSGTVVDASGGIVPEAAVKIVDAAKGGTARQVNTDHLRRLLSIDVQPGRARQGIDSVAVVRGSGRGRGEAQALPGRLHRRGDQGDR